VLPILNTNRGPVQAAAAARQGARADVVGELAAVRADIARALAAIDAQRAILQRLHAEITPLLAEHDRLLTIAAQAAELDLPSMIASENLVLESRIDLINARLDCVGPGSHSNARSGPPWPGWPRQAREVAETRDEDRRFVQTASLGRN
jgi:hypothetical protein